MHGKGWINVSSCYHHLPACMTTVININIIAAGEILLGAKYSANVYVSGIIKNNIVCYVVRTVLCALLYFV